MKRATLFLLGSFTLLLNSAAAHGQGCATTLSPHFSVYNTVSRDGTNIYTSVTMQGYANVSPSAGCQMNSATHHVGAENKLNGVDHWTYSGNGCPTCYFTATNNEQIVGVPGVVYLWNWDGVSICSIVGTFFGSGGGGSLPGCVTPLSETTTAVGTDPERPTVTIFNQVFGDTAADNFDGKLVQEGNARAAVDTCWYTGSTNDKVTGVGGSTWTVAGGEVAGQHNHWGFDHLGWLEIAVNNYRITAPLHGKTIPCGFTIYQSMQIKCISGSNVWVTFTPPLGNTLTATIGQSNVVNCRNDMSNGDCQTIIYP